MLRALVIQRRIDDSAPIKQKMVYASSKDAIKKRMEGCAELQGTSLDEMEQEDLINKISANRTK
jgi:cofilin